MKSILRTTALAAAGLALVAGQAQAAGLCKLTGSYSDNFGSTTSIKGKKGSILNTFICSTAYTFKVLNETKTGFTVVGKNPTKSCGTFTAALTFMGNCTVFGGTVTIHGQQLSDTFTKIPGSQPRQPSYAPDLIDGLQ